MVEITEEVDPSVEHQPPVRVEYRSPVEVERRPAVDLVDEDVGSEDVPFVLDDGKCFRFFFRGDDLEPPMTLRLRTAESSFAPATKSWGRRLLFAWRQVLMLYFFSVGVFYGIFSTKRGVIYPLVYLKSWGTIALGVYYYVAMLNSDPTILYHIYSRTQLFTRRWRWFTAIHIFLFDLTLVLETLITILYWSFEREGFCGLVCVTHHGLGTAALLIELCFSRMPIRPRHVLFTIIYPILWVVLQIVWVYTKHPSAYPGPLTFRNKRSIELVMFGLDAFVAIHFFFWLIALARDKICEGRFYPVDEGKLVDHPPLYIRPVPSEVGSSS